MSKNKILTLLLMVALLLPSIGFAGTYWVSPTGTTSWVNCIGETPLSGTTACSLATANANLSAGDTVYLRGGVYNTAIEPVNSGTSPLTRISYIAASGETPVISNVGIAVYLRNKSYIKLEGISVQAPVDRLLLLNYGSSYNEIKNCIFNGAGSVDTPKMWDGENPGGTPLVHNWIHGNIFSNIGLVNSSCDDIGGMQLGVPSYDNHSNNNTFENNIFYGGGHHNLETFTKYNVIRNNFFHHEGSMVAPKPPCPYGPDSNGMYGNRNIQIYDGHNSDGTFNLIEGNRFGPSGPPPDDDGGDGMTITAPKNIIRYNEVYDAQNNGIYFKAGAGSYSNYNRFYNNTIYKSGRFKNTGPQWQGVNYRDAGLYSSLNIVTIKGTDGVVAVTVTSPASWVTGTLLTVSGTTNYNVTNAPCTKIDDTTFTYAKAGTYAQETTGTARGTGPKLGNVIKNNIFYSYGSGGGDWSVHGLNDSYNTYANNFCTNSSARCSVYGQNPLFVDPTLPPITTTPNRTQPNLRLQSGSPAINGATHLTQASGTGNNSSTLVVDDALYFQDGTWGSALAGHQADWIAIGSVGNVVQIASINYATNTITLKSPMTWNDRANIWLYKKSDGAQVLYGSAPDFGAHEFVSKDIQTLSPPANLRIQ